MHYVNKLHNALLAVQGKHLDFFLKEGKKLMDYIDIDWNFPTGIVYHKSLCPPDEIKNDLDKIVK